LDVKPTEVTEEPAFVYSVDRTWVFSLVASGVCFIAAVAELLLNSAIGEPVFFVILGLLLLPWVVRGAAPRLRRAAFYEDHVELQGRDLQRNVQYSQISGIRLTKGIPFVSIPRWEITLKGEKEPLVMASNPKNKESGAKLISWLRQKAALNDLPA
jgi:hypothetical protein